MAKSPNSLCLGVSVVNSRPLSGKIERMPSLSVLNQEIVACTRCPRLIAHCQQIGREKRRAYMTWEYWAKPVPGFGDPKARVLILGLAPGAHGSNRTGRPFTGDGSGDFMYPVLHEVGFASQPTATHRDDGLKLSGVYITSVGRCAPPGNKPTPQELSNCSSFLDRELQLLKQMKLVLCHIAIDVGNIKDRKELRCRVCRIKILGQGLMALPKSAYFFNNLNVLSVYNSSTAYCRCEKRSDEAIQ